MKSNPDSFLLNNNLAFSYASLNKVKDARNYLKRARQTISEPFERIVLSATEGMVLYREAKIENNMAKIEKGRSFYMEAINEAEKQKNRAMHILAILNFAREEYLSNAINKETIENLIASVEKRDLEKDSIERSVYNLQKLLDKKNQ